MGADAPALAEAIEKHVGSPESTKPLSRSDKFPAAPLPAVEKKESQEELDTRLRGLMNQSKVVLFMKGSPDQPRCGFSRKICGLLREKNIEFSHYDILADESVRQGELVLLRIIALRELMMSSPQVSRTLITGLRSHSLSSRENSWED